MLDDKRIVYSHDVVFNESIFPLNNSSSPSSFSDSDVNDDGPDDADTLPVVLSPTSLSTPIPDSVSTSVPFVSPVSTFVSPFSSPVPVPETPVSPSPSPFSDSPPPSKLISSSIDEGNILSHRRRAAQGVSYHTNTKDPVTYKQALRRCDSNDWIKAINKELDALAKMNVWTEVELPEGEHALGTTWAFRRKVNLESELLKYKARLCAQGFSQIEGVDYHETYAPTGRLTTLRTMLSISATEDFEIQQMDAVGAFLNGIPDEVLYIRPPKGYSCKTIGKNIVLQLNKSLYGLKQSPRCWYNQLKEFFLSIKFSPSTADPCFFISSDPTWKCGVHLHVDDLSIMGQQTNRFKKLISNHFEMEDLGDCQSFLGMRITRDCAACTITLTQDTYIRNILQEYGMLDCQSVTTPMIHNTHLIPATEEELTEFQASKQNYRRAVGLLNYLVQCTRPDLAVVSSQLSQFLEKPGTQHWSAFKRVLKYLKGTQQLGLTLGGKPVILSTYTDSDYAGCPYTRRSTSGYCTIVAGGCVSWRARKQATVATSSTEAEYRAAYEGAQETVWIRQLLSDFGYHQQEPTNLFCDNQGSIALQKNPLYQSRTKHFEKNYHWIREKVEDKTIIPVYIPTAEMLADFLTKSLHRPKHEYCVNLLNMTRLASEGGS